MPDELDFATLHLRMDGLCVYLILQLCFPAREVPFVPGTVLDDFCGQYLVLSTPYRVQSLRPTEHPQETKT
jgi:hypothetical protein